MPEGKGPKVILFLCQGIVTYEVSVDASSIAKSGILNDRKSTTYHLDHKRLYQMQEMGVNIIHNPVVVDNNVITSTSPSAGLNVAFMLVEKLTSLANLKQVKKGMGFSDKHI